jgi:hypothetical protein
MISSSLLKKYHIGKKNEFDSAIQFFQDETRIADDQAFWLKVRDTLAGSLSETSFQQVIDNLKEAKGAKIERDPVESVQELQKHYGLSDTEKNGVLANLLQSGDMNKFGMVNAITRTSQSLEDYDRATEFERLGGKVLELPRSDWQRMAA